MCEGGEAYLSEIGDSLDQRRATDETDGSSWVQPRELHTKKGNL